MNHKATSVQSMFSSIAGRYDVTNSVLSLGLHRYWMMRALNLLPRTRTLNVLDVCTGTGALLPNLRRCYDQVAGVDFSRDMLKTGQELRDLKNIDILVQGDACCLPFQEGCFDILTVAYGVRNLVSLPQGLAEFKRVLKVGGCLLVLEFGQPGGAVWGNFFKLYSKFVMPFIGGFLTGNRAAYEYLPETSAAFPCGNAFVELLQKSGFTSLKTIKLTGGVAYGYLAERK